MCRRCNGGGNSLSAQTNYVAGWDGGTNTNSPSNFGWTSSANRTLNARNASSGIRMTTNYSGYKYENGNNYSYSSTSDPSSVIFWVRYNTAGESFTYTFKGLEPNHYYSFSGLVGWHNNADSPTFTVKLNDGTNDLATMTKSASAKTTLYSIGSKFIAPSTMTSTTDVKIIFTCNQTGDCMEAISALKLVEDFEVYRAELSDRFIPYATAVNGKLSNSTLATAISTAQGKVNDTSNDVTFDDVENLKSAITTAIEGYSYDPSGDDVSALLIPNYGFDYEINFPSSSSTATAAATVYPTFGWTPTVPGNCTGATIGYGYSGKINGDGNVTAPLQNADGTTDGGALAICVGWSGQVTYLSNTNTFRAGSYRITYRAYNGNTKNTTALNIIPKVGFVPTSGDPQLNSAPESFANQAWTTHTYDFTLDSDTEGQIQIGMQPTTNTNSYNAPELFIDEVKIEYFNPLTLAQIQWQEVHDELAALDATALPDAAELAITDALALAVPTTTVDDVNNAKAALQALIDSYDGIKTAYDNALALIDLATDEMANSTGLKTDIEAAISTANTNIETRTATDDLTSDYNTLEAARRTYVTSGAQPTFGHSFDWTFKMTNPDFEEGTTGWTNERNTTGQYNYGTTPTAMQHGTNGLDVWAPQINYIDVYQNQTLPAGVYELSAYVFSANPYKQHVYAHNGKDNPSANLTSTSEWQKLAVTFINTEEVSTKLGLYSKGQNLSGNTDGWFRLDNFQLLYQGDCASATMTVKAGQWGTFIAPFDVAIPDGVNAYTVTGVNASNYMVKEDVTATIPANTPVLLENTTEAPVNTTFYGKNISEADSYTEGLLTGIYTAATITAGSYVLQTPKSTGVQAFYPLASELTGTPNRCYLTLPASAAKRNAIFFDKEEGTTGIEAPDGANEEEGVFYNLAGQRVNRSYKGIIIQNRKAKLNN